MNSRVSRRRLVLLASLVALVGSLVLTSTAIGSGKAPTDLDADTVAMRDELDALATEKGEESAGSYLADKIAILTAHGETLDGFVMEIANPGGDIYQISYGQNQGTIAEFSRSWGSDGVAKDSLVSSKTYDTPRSGNLDASDARLSDPPSQALVDAIDALDVDHRAQLAKMHEENAPKGDVLTSLGIVGVARAATAYDNSQNYEDLTPGLLITRWGTGNHSMTVNSWGYWYGHTCGCADPTEEQDGLDAEWDPSDMYMTSVYWVPTGTYTAGPFGWHGVHNIAMTNAGNHAQLGADYQKPDKNSKYNDLYVKIAPKSSSVYGRGFNAYANYIHNWNFAFLSGIAYTVGYGFFAITAQPAFTGSWEHNLWKALTI
jgi:hypothetical protein